MQEYFNLEIIDEQIKNNINSVINTAENNFREELFGIANDIVENHNNTKIIFLGGPSSAGKTTSSRLLQEILESKGKKVLALEMDNFFKEYNQRKVLPDGSIDFDSLDAVDLNLINQCFTELFEKGTSKFPIFDFYTGESIKDVKEYSVDKDTIIIFEGIHVLNPELIKSFNTKDIVKIFINNETGYKGFGYTIAPRSLRLVRRMIRDNERRGKSFQATLEMWKNITEAEDLYITPFKPNADFIIDTSHEYEVNLYKDEIVNALNNNSISCDDISWLKVYEQLTTFNRKLLPKTTLMKEFVDIE